MDSRVTEFGSLETIISLLDTVCVSGLLDLHWVFGQSLPISYKIAWPPLLARRICDVEDNRNSAYDMTQICLRDWDRASLAFPEDLSSHQDLQQHLLFIKIFFGRTVQTGWHSTVRDDMSATDRSPSDDV